jgi:UDP-GlcNAc:undecaprenyl-phosphate GlcNAc-1-phosphate transferase
MTRETVGVALPAVAFVLSWALGWLARRVAPRFGLVDKPGGRKAHKAPTPLGGGVAIWLATILTLGLVALGAGVGRPLADKELADLIGGAWDRAGGLATILGLATVILAMGLADDRVGLGWRLRLGVQFGLATVFVLSGEQATLFGVPRWVTAILTVVWIVGLTNAFNFLDNMDALAASVGLIAALLFAGAQVAVGSYFVPAVLLILAGSLGGFLVHNRPPARLFMGDAGSNFLGFLLGTLTVAGTFTKPERGFSPFGVLAPLLVMAVPLYDTCSVILIRLREGRSPFQPDRSHFSHRLVERGLTPPRAVATIDLVTLAAGLGALLLHRLETALQAGVVVGQAVCLLGVVALLEVSTGRSERRDAQANTPPPTAVGSRADVESDGGAPDRP